MNIITRAEALEQGLKTYFTGKPCKRGHVDERQVSSWTCMECCRENDRARAGTEKRLASRRTARWKNIDANRKRDRERGKLPKRLENARAWKEANREYHNAASVQYTLNRLKTDPVYRLQCYLRGRVRKAVKAQGTVKAGRTNQIVGCSAAFLKCWLEAQFQEGMSWENYGAWHVDHIRPCASFDLTDPAQQRECFHYTNLQPLWAEQNREKSDRLDWVAA